MKLPLTLIIIVSSLASSFIISFTLAASSFEDIVPIRFQRCLNFQATYSGAYLVEKQLFSQVNFKAVGALEFASRHLWIYTQRGKPGKETGCCFKAAVGDEESFAILHLSGIEHQLVRRMGYEKGLAFMNKFSYSIFEAQGEKIASAISKKFPKPLEKYVTLIPFYGKQGFKALNTTSKGHFKPSYDAKVYKKKKKKEMLYPLSYYCYCLHVSSDTMRSYDIIF
jgi:hypothetical protein